MGSHTRQYQKAERLVHPAGEVKGVVIYSLLNSLCMLFDGLSLLCNYLSKSYQCRYVSPRIPQEPEMPKLIVI
jgi:hypothetical protein